MIKHRDEVKKALHLLWEMTARHDPDGPDLYITAETRKLKPKTFQRMLQEVDRRPLQGPCDMRFHLAHITEEYENHLGKRNLIAKLRHPKSTPSRGPRKLSLYVLTNGVWQGRTDLSMVIKQLVDHLISHNLRNKQVGIQFIQFGNDETGTNRLRKLDKGLNLELYVLPKPIPCSSVPKCNLEQNKSLWR